MPFYRVFPPSNLNRRENTPGHIRMQSHWPVLPVPLAVGSPRAAKARVLWLRSAPKTTLLRPCHFAAEFRLRQPYFADESVRPTPSVGTASGLAELAGSFKRAARVFQLPQSHCFQSRSNTCQERFAVTRRGPQTRPQAAGVRCWLVREPLHYPAGPSESTRLPILFRFFLGDSP